MDQDLNNQNGQDNASGQPPQEANLSDNNPSDNDANQASEMPKAEDSSSLPSEESEVTGQQSPSPEPVETSSSNDLNQPYVPAPDANNFPNKNDGPEANSEQSSAINIQGDIAATQSLVESDTQNTPPLPAEPTSEADGAVVASVETDTQEEAIPPEDTSPAPETSAAEPTVKPTASPSIDAEAGDSNEVRTTENDDNEQKPDKKRRLKEIIADTEKSVIIAVVVVATALLAIVLYFVMFGGGDSRFVGYDNYVTYEGSLAPLNLTNETTYNLEYPVIMDEEAGVSSKISNWFFAVHTTANEQNDAIVNSIIDLRIDSQALLTLTKDQELALLGQQEGLQALVEEFGKDLNDRFAVTDAEFIFNGTGNIGVDDYDSYSFDFTGTANNPDSKGDPFTIKGRYIIGFSDETRFSLTMLGEEEYWNAGLKMGTWDEITTSLDIN